MMVIDALLPWTRWLLAFHIMSVMAWMAGMFYLPRLFVYHCQVMAGAAESERFKLMERRLLRAISTPAMISSFLFGGLLVLTPGAVDWHGGWWHLKLLCVVLMAGFHGLCARWRRDFANDANTRSENSTVLPMRYSTLLMIVIVIMVVVRPF